MKFEYKNWPFSNKIVPFPFSGFQGFSVYYGHTGKLSNAKTSVNILQMVVASLLSKIIPLPLQFLKAGVLALNEGGGL